MPSLKFVPWISTNHYSLFWSFIVYLSNCMYGYVRHVQTLSYFLHSPPSRPPVVGYFGGRLKLRSPPLRTQSWPNVLPFKLEVGQNSHACFSHCQECPDVLMLHSWSIELHIFQILFQLFHCVSCSYRFSCLPGEQNGSRTLLVVTSRRLKQVPVLRNVNGL